MAVAGEVMGKAMDKLNTVNLKINTGKFMVGYDLKSFLDILSWEWKPEFRDVFGIESPEPTTSINN